MPRERHENENRLQDRRCQDKRSQGKPFLTERDRKKKMKTKGYQNEDLKKKIQKTGMPREGDVNEERLYQDIGLTIASAWRRRRSFFRFPLESSARLARDR